MLTTQYLKTVEVRCGGVTLRVAVNEETLDAYVSRTLVIELGSHSISFRVPSLDGKNPRAVFGSIRGHGQDRRATIANGEDDGYVENFNEIAIPLNQDDAFAPLDYDALRARLAKYIAGASVYCEAIFGVPESVDVGPHQFDFR